MPAVASTFFWTSQNTGQGTARGPWYDSVYFSLDRFFDPQFDVYAGFIEQPTGPGRRVVAAVLGASLYSEHDSDSNYDDAQDYYIIVVADSSDRVYERDGEGDNRVSS